jgi:hypothetical protein
MINGSWSNKNQFPSPVFPQPMATEQPRAAEKDASLPQGSPAKQPDIPSFLAVDTNGTGGLMNRARGTGGANPSLMVPSDVNPNMRMVTPIDSGKDAMLGKSTTPSTVSSYAELFALTRTDVTQPQTRATTTQRRLVPFEGDSLMDEKVHRPNDLANAASAPINIKVKRFRGNKSVMEDHREGFSKSEKHHSTKPLDHNHHMNLDGQNGTHLDPAQPALTRQIRQQHPQQESLLPSTRLVPFTGTSLMEEATKRPQDRLPATKTRLVKFVGQSMMEQERQLQIQQEAEIQSKYIHPSRHRLVPYSRSKYENGVPRETPAISGAAPDSVPSNTVVLYNKKAAVASSVVHSPKREYYYIQYRAPTDSTMARKTGLQVNTPISLWVERDKFLDT